MSKHKGKADYKRTAAVLWARNTNSIAERSRSAVSVWYTRIRSSIAEGSAVLPAKNAGIIALGLFIGLLVGILGDWMGIV